MSEHERTPLEQYLRPEPPHVPADARVREALLLAELTMQTHLGALARAAAWYEEWGVLPDRRALTRSLRHARSYVTHAHKLVWGLGERGVTPTEDAPEP